MSKRPNSYRKYIKNFIPGIHVFGQLITFFTIIFLCERKKNTCRKKSFGKAISIVPLLLIGDMVRDYLFKSSTVFPPSPLFLSCLTMVSILCIFLGEFFSRSESLKKHTNMAMLIYLVGIFFLSRIFH